MADSSKSKSGGGCLGKILTFILLGGAVGLGVALFFISQPQDLSDIEGYGRVEKPAPVRDLKVVIQNSLDRGYPLTLKETEINQWLARTLTVRQGGLLADWVSLKRVGVRLEDGFAEIVMERMVMGKPFTTSMFVKIEQLQSPEGVETSGVLHGGRYLESLSHPKRGGRFGRLVVPQGFLILVMPAYEKLAKLFSEEVHLGFEEMARIRIEKGRLILDPRDPTGDMSGLPQTF